MTDIARRDSTDIVPTPTLTSIEAWAIAASRAHGVATSLADTMFIPQSLRGKPADITAAILTGAEMGLQPMAALRSLDVIQGTPAFRANTLRGLVQAHGHDIWVESTTDTKAVVKGRRFNSDNVETATWTIERAQRLGLTSKPNWKSQPGTMLVARATTDIARRIAADVILALPYSSEELDDGEAAPAETVKRKRAPRPEPVEEPTPVVPEPVPVIDVAAWPAVEDPDLDFDQPELDD